MGTDDTVNIIWYCVKINGKFLFWFLPVHIPYLYHIYYYYYFIFKKRCARTSIELCNPVELHKHPTTVLFLPCLQNIKTHSCRLPYHTYPSFLHRFILNNNRKQILYHDHPWVSLTWIFLCCHTWRSLHTVWFTATRTLSIYFQKTSRAYKILRSWAILKACSNVLSWRPAMLFEINYTIFQVLMNKLLKKI